jgi:hypothetical protein
MFRPSSPRGAVLLVVAVAALFVPLAAASSADRPAQTLTMLSLVCALAMLAFVWLLLVRRGIVRAAHLGLAAMMGAYLPIWLIPFVDDLASAQRELLNTRLLVIGALFGLGCWLFVIAMRLMFPRRQRGMALAAIVVVLVGLFPGPTFLLQPGVAALNMGDSQLQLRAGFLYWTVGAALLIAPFLALMTLPGDWFERAWASASARVMSITNRRFAIGLMVATFALATFFAIYSFDRRATTADEIAQLWHARMLLSGHLAMPQDPNPEFFAIDNIIDRPRWMSQFPIGGPAVLAIGLLFRAAWLLNPVLTALVALNVYRFAQRAYGEPQARAAATVVATSPMLLVMGGTYMNHTPTAWLVTLALAALPMWVGSGDGKILHRAAAVIGGCIGAAITIRPLDGVVAGLVVGLMMLAIAARDRLRARTLLTAVGVGAVPVALLLVANWNLTGSPTRFGYEVLWGSNHSLGLHDDPTGNPHTAWRAFLLGVKYAAQMNWIVTAWPIPILLILSAGLLAARRTERWDALLLSLFGAQLAMYAFYWHDGQFIGPRFLFTAVPALLVLVSRAPFFVAERAGHVWRRIAIVLIPVCIGVSWLRTMPPFGVQGLAKEFRESRTRLKVTPPRDVQNGIIQDALVFVQEGAATRLLHRLWGVGVSRPDAARLLATSDACTLTDAVRNEEQRAPGDSAGRLRRIQATVKPFRRSPASPRVPDQNFHVSDTTLVTPACAKEIALDLQVKNTIAYGPMLLLNRFDANGRIGGPAVYLMDLGERNEALRGRFGDRRWFRYEVPANRGDTVPVLVPYQAR